MTGCFFSMLVMCSSVTSARAIGLRSPLLRAVHMAFAVGLETVCAFITRLTVEGDSPASFARSVLLHDSVSR